MNNGGLWPSLAACCSDPVSSVSWLVLAMFSEYRITLPTCPARILFRRAAEAVRPVTWLINICPTACPTVSFGAAGARAGVLTVGVAVVELVVVVGCGLSTVPSGATVPPASGPAVAMATPVDAPRAAIAATLSATAQVRCFVIAYFPFSGWIVSGAPTYSGYDDACEFAVAAGIAPATRVFNAMIALYASSTRLRGIPPDRRSSRRPA